MSKKILMIVGDFSEDYEVMVPFQALELIGHEVSVVCPDKRKGDTIKTAIHDFEGDQTFTEKPGHNFALNATFAEASEADFDALCIPGGRAPEYLRVDERVLNLVRDFVAAEKPIAATCHGIQILAAAKVLTGITCTAYPAVAPEIEAAGGHYKEVPIDGVFTEGKLVTSPAWPGNGPWIAQFLELLGTKITT